MERRIKDLLQENVALVRSVMEGPLGPVADVIDVLIRAFRNGNKVLIFGNGGSASDAQHIAAEFVNRFIISRPALPALALTTDTSILTSVGNDDSFDAIFERQIHALGAPGDVAWGISTSGTSRNVIRGLEAARESQMTTVVLTGGKGADAVKAVSDHIITVPSSVTFHIQEAHITISHIICKLVEDGLFPEVT